MVAYWRVGQVRISIDAIHVVRADKTLGLAVDLAQVKATAGVGFSGANFSALIDRLDVNVKAILH